MICGNILKHERLAQLGEHFLDVEGVMSSSLLALTMRTEAGMMNSGFFMLSYVIIRNLFQPISVNIPCFCFNTGFCNRRLRTFHSGWIAVFRPALYAFDRRTNHEAE